MHATPNSDTLHYINVYRTGGHDSAKWHECQPVLGQDAARVQRNEIERMGYKVLTKTLTEHQIIGLPVGWCGSCNGTTGACTGRKGCEA